MVHVFFDSTFDKVIIFQHADHWIVVCPQLQQSESSSVICNTCPAKSVLECAEEIQFHDAKSQVLQGREIDLDGLLEPEEKRVTQAVLLNHLYLECSQL